MKKHVKRRIGRVISPIAIGVLKLHTRITGQQRARILVWNEKNELLLVRGMIGPKWSLPGGGIEKGETPEHAVIRELYEETGIKIDGKTMQLVAILKQPEIPVNYVAHMFTVTVQSSVLPDVMHNPHEIIELGWFSPNSLLPDTSPLVHASLAALSKQPLF